MQKRNYCVAKAYSKPVFLGANGVGERHMRISTSNGKTTQLRLARYTRISSGVGIVAYRFFKKNDGNVGEHDRRPDDAHKPYPVPAACIGIDGKSIEGAKEQRIYPDSGPPPGLPGHKRGIEVAAIPVNKIYHTMWWPNGVLEIVGIGNDKLLDIHDIGDKEQIDDEEKK